MIIAIDGPAASGKGTIARAIARHFGLPHLDTGLLYRATALRLLQSGADLQDPAAAARAASNLTEKDITSDGLRDRHIGEAASVVAAMPKVRQALIAMQREFAAQPGGAVLDGRDIGTFICPDAAVKIFVTAEPETRALRRAKELQAKGEDAPFDAVLKDIRKRDERDSERSAAPLRRDADAALLDTTDLNIDDAIAAGINIVNSYRRNAN